MIEVSHMGFGVADLVISWMFRISVRFVLYWWTVRWKLLTAELTHHSIHEPFWGCPSFELSYKFAMDGHQIESSSKVPMMTMYYARKYAEGFSEKMPIGVRVDPKNSKRTMYFELDQ